jgi:hypothetical protein
MNINNETIGLRVLSVSPSHQLTNVNINSSIEITFSSDINPASFVENIVVLEDYNKIYRNVNSLKDYSQYSVVKGSISYRDKILTYTPNEPFKTDACYVVMLSDKITDITGNKMIKKHVSCFYTESVASFPRCEIIAPKYGSIISAIPEFLWKNQYSESYIFQVSKSNTFELLLCDDVIPGNKLDDVIKHKPVFNAKEGMYHIRVKSENGEWSNTHQIFIKEILDAVVSQEDTSEILHLNEFLDGLEEPIEILEYFPSIDSVNNSLKTNIIYIKIKGKVDEHRIRLEDCYVYGESFDEEHEEYAHETVDGKWTVIYDSYFDVSYIIFTPANLDDIEEVEYIETLRSGNLIQTISGGVNNED